MFQKVTTPFPLDSILVILKRDVERLKSVFAAPGGNPGFVLFIIMAPLGGAKIFTIMGLYLSGV